MAGLIEPVAGTARTRDGLELRTLRWPANTKRASLLLVHGIAEHIGRYAHVGTSLAQAGIETYGYDLRGFGQSSGRRAYVDRWSQHHDDLEDQFATIGDGPVVLYGHSMGGLIALGYVLAETPRRRPDLLVLSAPAIGATVARWMRTAAEIIGRIAPSVEIPNALPPGALSRDPRIEDEYRSDPLNVHRTTARLGMELFHEQARLRARLGRISPLPMPTYVLHGSDDPIVPLTATAQLGGRENVTRRVYPGLRHETHNEPESAAVIADTIAWIETRLAAMGQVSS